MNLYHVSQNKVNGYDTYSDFVVCAAIDEDARNTHPGTGCVMTAKDWKKIRESGTWCSRPEDVDVRFIGFASPAVQPGIICASFHAG